LRHTCFARVREKIFGTQVALLHSLAVGGETAAVLGRVDGFDQDEAADECEE
jgi:hypothetical protein